MTDSQIAKLAEEHGLCTLVPDAGYEHGALWFHENCMAFARSIEAAERERCANVCLGLKNSPRDIRAPLPGIDVACDVANAMAEKCAAVIRGA